MYLFNFVNSTICSVCAACMAIDSSYIFSGRMLVSHAVARSLLGTECYCLQYSISGSLYSKLLLSIVCMEKLKSGHANRHRNHTGSAIKYNHSDSVIA